MRSLYELLETIDDSKSLRESYHRRFLTEDDEFEVESEKENTAEQNNNEDSEYTLSGDLEKDFQEVKNKLMSTSSYSGYIEELKDIINDPKLYTLLKDGFGKVDPMKVTVKKGVLPVKQLHPTQSEIDLTNSLLWPLSGGPEHKEDIIKGNIANAFSGAAVIKAPVVTFNGEYVIDGHHRWSQIYCQNPDAKLQVINFQYAEEDDPIDVLKLFQTSIAIAQKEIPVATVKQGMNIYGLSTDQISKWIAANISDVCVETIKEYVPSITDKQSAIAYFTKNVNELKTKNGPADGAPSRALMPQTSPASMEVIQHGQSKLTEMRRTRFRK